MRHPQPIEVSQGVYQMKVLAARVTVILAGEHVTLVDSGARGSFSRIEKGLGVLGIRLSQVRLVVLTHYHPDHTGEAAKIAEVTGATVAAHVDDAKMMNGEVPTPTPFRKGLLQDVTRPLLRVIYSQPVKVDLLLNDGDVLPTEPETRVIHVPGHTAGSICLYVVPNRVLIVGDALQYRFGRLSQPASNFTQNPAQARESVTRLLSVDFETICFGHFPPLKHDAREALRRAEKKWN